MIIVSTIEIQNNFKKYLQAVENGDEVVITNDNKEVARLIPPLQRISFLSDSLVGILKNNYSEEEVKKQQIHK